MKTRTKVVTSAAGVLLLAMAGGSLALWSDVLTGDDVVASTGHLDVTMQHAKVYDISPLCQPQVIPADGTTPEHIDWASCRVDTSTPDLTSLIAAPSTITRGDIGPQGITDIADFKMVPGDTIRVLAPVEADLLGQNIAAKLSVEWDAIAANQPVPGVGFDTSTTAMTLADQFLVTPKGVVEGDTVNAALAAAGTIDLSTPPLSNTGGGPLEYYFVEGSNTPVWAVFDVTFLDLGVAADGVTGLNDSDGITDPTTNPRDLMDVDTGYLIKNVKASLIQVRS